MKSFLRLPLPKEAHTMQCRITRRKTSGQLYPVYEVYLREGDRFLMCAKKKATAKTSYYSVSSIKGDLRRQSGACLGKVRSNFLGTEFCIYDDGVNPKSARVDDSEDMLRRELGVVFYAANVLGSRGPRKMQVCIPDVDTTTSEPTVWRPQRPSGTMLARIRAQKYNNTVYMINKPPRWNDDVGAYVLNFNGRVTMASVKNFQLVEPENQDRVILQFGRVAKDEFTMDFVWPMSPFQAFAITLSSFDSKIACD
eukprot:scaffold2710_cov204-Pinguiococcus_pyrenoidosus.AAC.6